MKRFRFAVLITVAWFVLNVTVNCLASDEWECLFCHRYPGLVMPEGTDKFKIISIDTEKHFASPHGKSSCRACHSRIDSVPHTGVTEIECTNGCHVEDRDKIETMNRSEYKVHKDEQRSIKRLKDRSSCGACHPLYPHTRNLKVRAILNMHIGYMLCGLCHLKKENLGEIIYDWKSPDKARFTGEPYGRYTKVERGMIEKIWDYISGFFRSIIMPKTSQDKTGRVEYMLSRIAAFSMEKEKKILLVDTEDTGKVIEFREREKNLSDIEIKNELKYFHRDITEQEFSVACNQCHSTNSILAFKQLGYDDKKTGELKDMDVKRLETEYKIFHFPHMLN